MDKTLRNALIGSIIVLTIAISYYLVAGPLLNKTKLQECLTDADKTMSDYIHTLGTRDDNETLRVSRVIWDKAEKLRKEKQDICFKQHPQ